MVSVRPSRLFAVTTIGTLALTVGLAAFTGHALAQAAPSPGVIDSIVLSFKTTAATWEATLQRLAMGTFALLATLQLTWAIMTLIFRNQTSDIWSELINQIMSIGLFLWLLTTTSVWAPLIIQSFRFAGGAASGLTVVSPGDVFVIGVNIASGLWQQMSIWSPAQSIVFVVCALIVLMCFAWIAATMVIALVQSYFIASAGVIFMAFGASRWTREVALTQMRGVFAIGAKLFALQLVVSIGMQFIQQWQAQSLVNAGSTAAATGQAILIEIGQALVLAAVTKSIPDMFERMVWGVGFANGTALFAAAASVAAATVAVAAAITGGAAAIGAAARLASAQVGAVPGAVGAAGTASGVSRVARLAAATGRNTAQAAVRGLSPRLGGQNGAFRQAAQMNARASNIRQNTADQQQATGPTPTPSNPTTTQGAP